MRASSWTPFAIYRQVGQSGSVQSLSVEVSTTHDESHNY
jgi:hypothetical protein